MLSALDGDSGLLEAAAVTTTAAASVKQQGRRVLLGEHAVAAGWPVGRLADHG